MIREFLSSRRLLFFPKRWANSVTQWICGVHSPSGTLKIVNTANPSRGRSASFDVDIEAVWAKLRDLIDAEKRGEGGQNLRDSKDETFGDKIQSVVGADLTHDDITDWGTATADFLTDADMSAYALDADLSALEEDVADIADVVDAIDADLYDASGNKTWVDTSTAQTVGGTKTFTNGTWFRNSANIGVSDGSRMNISSWSIEIYPPNTSTYGGYIDFHYAGSSEDWTSRVIDDSNGLLLCTKKKVRLTSGSGYYAELDKVPADDSATNSVRIATLGWVNNYFSRKSHNHDAVYSKLGHTHSGYAATNHTHSGYALSNHNHAGVYAEATHQHVASDITDLGNAVDAKISTFSNTLSGVYATLTEFDQLSSLVNEIDNDLADAIDSIEVLADWYGTGASGTMKMCTGVTWNGTKLAYTYRNITVSHGLITNIPASDMSADIDTPAVITWS